MTYIVAIILILYTCLACDMSIASACMHVWPKNLKHKAIANSTIVFIANYVHHHMQSLMFSCICSVRDHACQAKFHSKATSASLASCSALRS